MLKPSPGANGILGPFSQISGCCVSLRVTGSLLQLQQGASISSRYHLYSPQKALSLTGYKHVYARVLREKEGNR